MTYNKATLVGNLGADPRVVSTDGMKLCTLSLATNYRSKNSDGKYETGTDWHSVVAFGKLSEICAKHLKKGSRILVEGYLKPRKYTAKDGHTQYQTQVVAEEIRFLDGIQDSDAVPIRTESNQNVAIETDEIPF